MAAGQATGSVSITASDDVYVGGDTASVAIVSSTGGNFENLIEDKTPATTTISDDTDTTTVNLSATPTVTEGGTITYTATLTNTAQTPVTVNLNNGETITIAARQATGPVSNTDS